MENTDTTTSGTETAITYVIVTKLDLTDVFIMTLIDRKSGGSLLLRDFQRATLMTQQGVYKRIRALLEYKLIEKTDKKRYRVTNKGYASIIYSNSDCFLDDGLKHLDEVLIYRDESTGKTTIVDFK